MSKKIIFVTIIVISILTGISLLLMNKQSKEYIIITDARFKTLLNDGGTHYNIYYKINNNIVQKYEDYYIGFKGYKYKEKLIYEKKINNKIKKEFIKLINVLMNKDDNNSNYSYYEIKVNKTQKIISNKESIDLIEDIINKIDNL